MIWHALGTPAEFGRRLEYALRSVRPAGGVLYVKVTARLALHRKCAVHEAHHYLVQAYFTTADPSSLDALEAALRKLSAAEPWQGVDVYLTTQVRGADKRGRNRVANPNWPAALGPAWRGFHSLRPQVMALVRERR